MGPLKNLLNCVQWPKLSSLSTFCHTSLQRAKEEKGKYEAHKLIFKQRNTNQLLLQRRRLYDRLFNRHRSVHQILGGAIVADVMLWRRKDLTAGILVVTLAAWVMFEMSGYTLLSFASSVLLLLFTILFLWAKSAAILNRPAPPLPHFHLSEETANEAATFIRNHVNRVLSVCEDVALGRDTGLYVKVGLVLLMIFIVGRLTNFLTLAYTSLVVVLTIPALYERYENYMDACALMAYRRLQQSYARFHQECCAMVHKWIFEKKKLA